MAAAASITLSGSITSAPTGGKTFSASISSAAACPATQTITLQSGANTITVPTAPAPKGCVIKLPAANTVAITLKGVTGDTGVAIGKTGFIVLSWETSSPPSSFCLTAASACADPTEISFF